MLFGSFWIGCTVTRLDMWPLRTVMFLLCCAGCCCQNCNLTKPYFKSQNFFSVLHWDPVDLPGQTALYSVQYIQYGSPRQRVSWCQNISSPVCDLTDVMSEVMTEVTIGYKAIIYVGAQCVGEVKFYPFKETTLAAPQLTVTSNQTHLNVTLSQPRVPWNRSIESMRYWSDYNGGNRYPVKYNVHLTHPGSQEYFSRTSPVLIELLWKDVKYCGEVFYSLTHPGWSGPSENTTFCLTVSAPNPLLHILMWPSVLAALLMAFLSVMLCHRFVNRKRSLPKALMLPGSNSPAIWSDPTDNISKVEMWSGMFFGIKPDPQTPSLTPQKSEITVKDDIYASQDPYRCQQNAPIQNSREPLENYSLCLPAQMPKESFNSSDSFSPGSESAKMIHSDTTESLNNSDSFPPKSDFVKLIQSDTNESFNNSDSLKPESDLVQMIHSSANESFNNSDSFSPESDSVELIHPDTNESFSSCDSFIPETDSFELIQSDSESRTLVVPARPDKNGTLQFHELIFQDDSFPDESAEQMPLLTDLIHNDSSYLPGQVSNTVTSNYRQNWVPGLLEGQDKRTYIMRTEKTEDSPEAEEDFRESEDSRVGLVFLDRCLLELQRLS